MAPSKKRKVNRAKANSTAGTIIRHYFNFIANTLDISDKHEGNSKIIIL
jgi:hypothetical protein